MELKDFVKLLRKHWLLITLATAVCVGASAVFTAILPAKYFSSIDVYVKRMAAEDAGEYYTYDGYYSAQASIQYTDTVAGMFASLPVIKDAAVEVEKDELYSKAENEPEVLSEDVEYLEDVADSLLVENLAPQMLKVTSWAKNRENAEIWVRNIGEQVVHLVADMSVNSADEYRLTVSEPLTKEKTPSMALNVVAGFIAGLTLGITSAFLVEYLKED